MSALGRKQSRTATGQERTVVSGAAATGGRIPYPPEDRGFMYDQGFEDIDGHLWNLVWTAPEA
jgi:uncharacterized protein